MLAHSYIPCLNTGRKSPGTIRRRNTSLNNSSSLSYILKSARAINRGLSRTQQLRRAFCRPPHSLFSSSQFSLSPSLSHHHPFSALTGCHHIFSQLPTTSYSATVDLNTDLASSVPLRQERERYRTLSLPPCCCRLEFCLSHQSSGCWSTPCYFYTFCLSADQSPDRKERKEKRRKKTGLWAQQDNSHRQVGFMLSDGGQYIRPEGLLVSHSNCPRRGFILVPSFAFGF